MTTEGARSAEGAVLLEHQGGAADVLVGRLKQDLLVGLDHVVLGLLGVNFVTFFL